MALFAPGIGIEPPAPNPMIALAFADLAGRGNGAPAAAGANVPRTAGGMSVGRGRRISKCWGAGAAALGQ